MVSLPSKSHSLVTSEKPDRLSRRQPASQDVAFLRHAVKLLVRCSNTMWNGDSSKNRPQHPMSRDSSHNGHYRPPPGYPEQPPHPYDVYAQAPYPPVDRGYDPRYHPDAYYGRPYPEPPPYGYPPHRHSSAESASAVQQQEASRKETPRSQTPPEPRGKPEAMAKAVAAAALDAQRKELEEERSKLQAEAVVEATEEEVVVDTKPTSSSSELPMMAQVVSQPPASPKPKKKARKPASKKSTATPKTAVHNELRQKQPPITDAEYQNLEALLTQFCRVPLLAEFSRPVTLLHPEVSLRRDPVGVATTGHISHTRCS